MSSLKDLLGRMIRADGPMPLSTFMTLCLHHKEHGYYASRPGLGKDFITAPETSQIFGDLIGLWLAHTWQAIGAPDRFNLVELGAGRATLMQDALRASKAMQEFQAAFDLTLIDASPHLEAIQADRLQAYQPAQLRSLDELGDGAALIVANEYLDCLPARQFLKQNEIWQERVIGLNAAGELELGLSVDRAPQTPDGIAEAQTIVEFQPGLESFIEQLRARAEHGSPVCALLFDYGPNDVAPGDTFRAYSNGQQIDPLSCPGESDLTVDVDFGRLKRIAEKAGLIVHGPVQQGEFLLRLGAEAYLNRLITNAPDKAQLIYDGARRLIDPADMGAKFKAICISNQTQFTPAGF